MRLVVFIVDFLLILAIIFMFWFAYQAGRMKKELENSEAEKEVKKNDRKTKRI